MKMINEHSDQTNIEITFPAIVSSKDVSNLDDAFTLIMLEGRKNEYF